jgi:two-component system response regulator YesN
MGTPETVKQEARDYVEEMAAGAVSLSTHRFMVMELVSSLYRFAISNRIETEPIFGEDESLFRNVTNMDTEQLTGWLSEVGIKMQEQLQNIRTDGAQSFVTRAIDYVRDNYGDQELTIDKICGILGVSAAYFSTTFKKETGKTFINYLTDYRMEQAVQLLIERDEKTYVIAAQVGYSDPAYFSYVFKKRFGVSPTRYRRENK